MENLTEQAPCECSDLACMIGQTPLVQINFLYKGDFRSLYFKIEHFNFTGSIKDRMALHIIRESYKKGSLKKGDTIVEATSGNTGISFAAIGKALGHSVIIFMPDWMSDERKNLIRQYGAQIVLVSKEEGGFIGAIKAAEEYATQHPNVFLPRQFENKLNREAHYYGTGSEIVTQLSTNGVKLDAFIAGVGTGGTIMGVADRLKEWNESVKCHPLEPENSPTLSTGYKVGQHRIQGISDEFVPDLLHLDQLDPILMVDDGDAIEMSKKLGKDLGLGVGISSGANFIGALQVLEEMGGKAKVLSVFCDSNKKYLSTDLAKAKVKRTRATSDDVLLINYKVLAR